MHPQELTAPRKLPGFPVEKPNTTTFMRRLNRLVLDYDRTESIEAKLELTGIHAPDAARSAMLRDPDTHLARILTKWDP